MSKFKQSDIWVADTESTTYEFDQDKTSVGLIIVGNKNTGDRLLSVSIKDFLYKCFKYKIERVFFHNLAGDGRFIEHGLIDLGYQPLENLEDELRPMSYNYIKDRNANYYFISVMNSQGETIRFVDSYKLIPLSVKKMGDYLGFVSKGELDYHRYGGYKKVSQVPKEAIEYISKDIEIPQHCLEYFNSYYPLRLTVSSASRQDFTSFYGASQLIKDFGGVFRDGKVYNILTQPEWDLFKDSFWGGFVGYKKEYENVDLKEHGVNVDMNNMYGKILYDYKLPYGKVLTEQPKGDYVKFYHVYIKKAVKIDDDMPHHLHFERTAKEVYGNVIKKFAIYSHPEGVEICKTYQVDYSLIEVYYFKAKYIFKNGLDKINRRREKASNKMERTIHKFIANTAFGKFGENYRRVSKRTVYDPRHEIKTGTRFGKKGDYVEIAREIMEKYLSYIPLATYITSMGRCMLLDAIRKNKTKVIRGDTDGISILGKPVGLEYDEEKLGKWKIEDEFNRIKVLKNKCYMFHSIISNERVIKVAGVPEKNKRMFTGDNFRKGEYFENFKTVRKNIQGGYVLRNGKFTL